MDRQDRSGDSAAKGLLDRLESRLLAEPRKVPGARPLRTALRTGHVIALSVLYGGHFHDLPPDRLVSALIATVATGGAFACLEFYRAPIWLAQIRGVATLVKLALVASAAVFWDWRLPILTLTIAIGVVTSHMPGRYRYYSLLHGRSVDQGGKG